MRFKPDELPPSYWFSGDGSGGDIYGPRFNYRNGDWSQLYPYGVAGSAVAAKMNGLDGIMHMSTKMLPIMGGHDIRAISANIAKKETSGRAIALKKALVNSNYAANFKIHEEIDKMVKATESASDAKKTCPEFTVAFGRDPAPRPDRPVAAFDFDSTLAPCRGTGAAAEDTKKVLRRVAKTHNVVIFSNRSRGKTADLAAYAQEVGCSYFASLEHDAFRKPHPGMWHLYLALMKASYVFEPRMRAGSWYCGDAAGRSGADTAGTYTRAYPKHRDFAAHDLNFARHIGLRFLTPEFIFPVALGVPIPHMPWPAAAPPGCDPDVGLDPADIKALSVGCADAKSSADLKYLPEAVGKQIAAATGVCIVMMGSPGSGKSRHAKMVADKLGITLISRETADRKAIPLAEFHKQIVAAASGANMIIDGTNATAATRRHLFALAKSRNPRIFTVIVHMTTSKKLSMHLNSARCEQALCAEVPSIAIHTYWKNREPPTVDECALIVEVPFALAAAPAHEVAEWRWG